MSKSLYEPDKESILVPISLAREISHLLYDVQLEQVQPIADDAESLRDQLLDLIEDAETD